MAPEFATNEEIAPDLFLKPFEFAHRHLIRMNGSGAAWLDIDDDGDWDLYLVNGAGGPETTNALYRNEGGGIFTPFPARAAPSTTARGWPCPPPTTTTTA